MSKWQPISTAPKDDDPVLLCGPLRDGGFYRETCKWYPPGKMGRGCWPVIWMADHGEPTHWQPLPPLPEDDTATLTQAHSDVSGAVK